MAGVDLPSIDQFTGALCVARHGSFTRAAKELGLSQSALSRQVMTLEKRLGVRLFDRVGRRVRLTAAGEQVVARAGTALEELERLVVNLSSPEAAHGGRVRLGCTESLAIHVLPAILAAFRQNHRGVGVQVVCERADRLPEAVTNGSVDLAVTTLEYEPPELRATALWDEELVLVLPGSHRARSRSVASYLREPFILPDPACATRRHIDHELARRKVELQVAVEHPSFEVIKALVRSGLGLALLPEVTVRQETRAGTLAAWPLADLPLRRPIAALTDPRHEPWPAEVELLQALREYAR